VAKNGCPGLPREVRVRFWDGIRLCPAGNGSQHAGVAVRVGGLPPGCGGYSVTIARRMLSLAARLAGLMAVTTPAMAARMTMMTRVR